MARRPKPAMAAWIAAERHRLELKPADLVARLRAQGVDVVEQTIRVWESYAGRDPSPENIDALERIFGSQAPGGEPADTSALVAAIDRLTAAVERGQVERRAWEMELIRAVAELRGAPMPEDVPASGPPEGALR